MSIEDDPKKLRQDDAQATPEWHRARAKDLRKNGFTKMAEEHEHIARTIERQRRGEQQTKKSGRPPAAAPHRGGRAGNPPGGGLFYLGETTPKPGGGWCGRRTSCKTKTPVP